MSAELAWKIWNEAWNDGLWAATWEKTVDGLTAAQAAWRPAPDRNSIWQIVEHMSFWREVSVKKAAGGAGPDDAEVARSNFPQPAAPTDAAWQATVNRFRASQQLVAAALHSGGKIVESAFQLIAHDSYHMGQVAYLRALQGCAVGV